jgi:adenylate cyclase
MQGHGPCNDMPLPIECTVRASLIVNQGAETSVPHEAQIAVLFADVSGSTQLYEMLGDVRARSIIARCIAVMTEATHRHGGTLVKTIGDEVMTTYPDAAAAAAAACAMQEGITGEMVVEGRPLAIRVGFHFGPTLFEEADVFGDAVNLAARLTNLAKSGQILTTAATVEHLTGPRHKSCRQIDLTQVRGKREQIAIYEVVWNTEGATIMRAPWATQHRAGGRLAFTAGGTRLELGEGHPSLTIGRADQNDLVVRQPVVSRLHARIEYRNGRFVLTDLSANGTYVAADGEDSSYVHRDNQELTGSGTLGLGEAVSPASQTRVRFDPV